VLLRQEEGIDGVLAIGQPSHAWVSGQLARNWGNRRFGRVEPREEVCLAAEQHDIGMARWDLEPSLNPRTGLPHSFIEMRLQDHLECWRWAAPRLIRQSRYAALLCSMHGARLYQMRDLARLDSAEADEIRSFLDGQRAFQDRLLHTLGDDPATAPAAMPERVSRNSDLIWTWDYLSLAVCLGWPPCSAKRVPTAAEPVELQLTPGEHPRQVGFAPWPFATDSVTVRCEGQRLTGRYESRDALAAGFAEARWETLEVELIPVAQ
jgi:Protein of unknown function (DUF3891)